MSGVAAPALSIDQLAPLLAKAYRLTVRDPRWLEGEYDRNLRLIDDAGAYWVVKISDGSAAPAVAWQEALLTHIEQHPLDFAVPRLLPTATTIGEGLQAHGAGSALARGRVRPQPASY